MLFFGKLREGRQQFRTLLKVWFLTQTISNPVVTYLRFQYVASAQKQLTRLFERRRAAIAFLAFGVTVPELNVCLLKQFLLLDGKVRVKSSDLRNERVADFFQLELSCVAQSVA